MITLLLWIGLPSLYQGRASNNLAVVNIKEGEMPYDIEKRGEKWVVFNTETKDVKGRHDSRIKAQRQINLLRGIEKGWEPTGKKARK